MEKCKMTRRNIMQSYRADIKQQIASMRRTIELLKKICGSPAESYLRDEIEYQRRDVARYWDIYRRQ